MGQFIVLHTPQHCLILSPEFCRRMAASVGPEAAPHLMELSHPHWTLTVKKNLGSMAAKQVFLRCLDDISAKTKICTSSSLYHRRDVIEVWVWTCCCCSLDASPILILSSCAVVAGQAPSVTQRVWDAHQMVLMVVGNDQSHILSCCSETKETILNCFPSSFCSYL